MEAFASPYYHPMAHGMAIEGMRLVKDYLPRLMADPSDLEARCQLMVASTMGATAFQKGLGAMHSLTHPAGGLLNTQQVPPATLLSNLLDTSRTCFPTTH